VGVHLARVGNASARLLDNEMENVKNGRGTHDLDAIVQVKRRRRSSGKVVKLYTMIESQKTTVGGS